MADQTETRILYVLRLGFWNTARAALQSLVGAYWEECDEYKKVSPLVEAFIERMDEIFA